MASFHWLFALFASQIAIFESDTGAINCGAASMCVAAKLCGVDVSPSKVEELFGNRLDADDISMAEIKAAAEQLGMMCQPVSLGSTAEVDHRVPLIVAIRLAGAVKENHFVVLYGGAPDYVKVLDYPWQARLVRPEDLERIWNGKGLYIAAGAIPRASLPASRSVNWSLGSAAVLVAIVGILYLRRISRVRFKPTVA